jgi:hypothetical protein
MVGWEENVKNLARVVKLNKVGVVNLVVRAEFRGKCDKTSWYVCRG